MYCYRNVSFALFNGWNVSKTSFDHEKAVIEGSCLCIHYSLSSKLFSFFFSFQFTLYSPLLFSYRQLYFSTLWILRSICKYFYLSFFRSFYLSPANHPSIPPSPSFLTGNPPYFTVPSPEPREESIREKCIGYVVFVLPIFGGRVAGLCRGAQEKLLDWGVLQSTVCPLCHTSTDITLGWSRKWIF